MPVEKEMKMLISKLSEGDLRDLMAKMMSWNSNTYISSGSFREINLDL